MRLVKLAREVGVTPSDIIQYLENQNLATALGLYSKLDHDIIEKVWEKFDPTGEIRESLLLGESRGEESIDEGTAPEEEVSNSLENELIKDSTNIKITLEQNLNPEEIIEIAEESESLTPEIVNTLTEEESTSLMPDSPEEDMEVFPIESEGPKHEAVKEDNVQKEVIEEVPLSDNIDRLENEPEDLSTEMPEEGKSAEILENQLTDAERQAEENKEVIRAKLVKLEGIKVVGKIDLPPPPKPKEKVDHKEEKIRKDRPRKKHRRGKRELSYEEKVEREKRKLTRERQKREKEIKAKKKRHYDQKMAKSGTSKISKPKPQLKNKRPKEKDQKMIESKRARNPISRLWGWLNGKYDNY